MTHKSAYEMAEAAKAEPAVNIRRLNKAIRLLTSDQAAEMGELGELARKIYRDEVVDKAEAQYKRGSQLTESLLRHIMAEFTVEQFTVGEYITALSGLLGYMVLAAPSQNAGAYMVASGVTFKTILETGMVQRVLMEAKKGDE